MVVELSSRYCSGIIAPRGDRYLPPGAKHISDLNPTAPQCILTGANEDALPASAKYAFRISTTEDADIRFSGVRGVVVGWLRCWNHNVACCLR